MQAICPQGEHSDEVHRLPDFCREETLEGSAQHELQKRLCMPAPAAEPQPQKAGLFMYFQLILWLTLAIYAFNKLAEAKNWTALVVFAAVLAVALLAELFIYRRRAARDKLEAAAYVKDMEEWQRARLRWEGLYYCSRHNLLFDPQAPGRRSDPEGMEGLLFPQKAG